MLHFFYSLSDSETLSACKGPLTLQLQNGIWNSENIEWCSTRQQAVVFTCFSENTLFFADVFGLFTCAQLMITIFPAARVGNKHCNNAEMSFCEITSPLWTHSSRIFMTSQMIGSQVHHQCGSTVMVMDNILPSSSSKKVQCVVALHASYFLSLKSWLFQFQSCCLAVFLLPLAFLLSPITSLLRQPEQMFSNILLTKQANSGCY